MSAGSFDPVSAGSRDREFVSLPISSVLLPGDSPRLQGKDAKHVARLAEIDEPLPPILVDRRSMRVIDGMHRLMAASQRGHKTIEVEFFDGTAGEAFLRAVEANISHGLPLSQEDRRAAAERIIVSHPQMSNRAIARASGMSAKSVATIREKNADTMPPLKARIGIDGKARPVDNAEGRRRAAELTAEFPHASLREVARHAGISAATVSDVRKRLASGLMPIPERRASKDRSNEDSNPAQPVADVNRSGVRNARKNSQQPASSLLDKLLKDPTLRMRDDGRRLLRLLQRSAVEKQGMTELVTAVPPHCTKVVADLVRQYADIWSSFAQELDAGVRGRDTDASVRML